MSEEEILWPRPVTTCRQPSAAFDYLKTHPEDPVNKAELEKACGVGVVVTREEIEQRIVAVIAENRQELLEKRYRFNFGKLVGKG